MTQRLIFATPCYRELQKKLCKISGYEEGQVEYRRFPDQEHHFRLNSSVAGKDVLVLGTSLPGGHFMELYDLAFGMVSYGARSLTMVLPYFAYSTMERIVHAGDVVTAKTRARVLSSLPQAAWNNRILLIDLHSIGIPHYFEGTLRPEHISGDPIVAEVIKKWGVQDFVLASTDAGRAKRVESIAHFLNVEPAFLIKKRTDSGQTKVVAPASPIDNKTVLIYDDMIRTGGSLIEAAKAYKSAGAGKIYGLTTHGLFTGNALNKIKESGYFEKIVATDTIPFIEEKADEFLEIYTVANLIADHLK